MFLLIDKPKGMTSHDVVDAVRKITGERRVGHGGTLDPNATGLLIVGVGREFTKQLYAKSSNVKKTYEAEIFLGEERVTGDSEGEVISRAKELDRIDRSQIDSVLASFLGKQKQVPPIYSAIKIKGKKAYELARKGKVVEMEPRDIVIHSIEVAGYSWPILKIGTEVSSGTYIRSLARDIGGRLGCGAYLKELRRTKVGDMKIEDAVKLEELERRDYH